MQSNKYFKKYLKYINKNQYGSSDPAAGGGGGEEGAIAPYTKQDLINQITTIPPFLLSDLQGLTPNFMIRELNKTYELGSLLELPPDDAVIQLTENLEDDYEKPYTNLQNVEPEAAFATIIANDPSRNSFIYPYPLPRVPSYLPNEGNSIKFIIKCHGSITPDSSPFNIKSGINVINFSDVTVPITSNIILSNKVYTLYESGDTIFENDDKRRTKTPRGTQLDAELQAELPPDQFAEVNIKNHPGNSSYFGLRINNLELDFNCDPSQECGIWCIDNFKLGVANQKRQIPLSYYTLTGRRSTIRRIYLNQLINLLLGRNPSNEDIAKSLDDKNITFVIIACRGAVGLTPTMEEKMNDISQPGEDEEEEEEEEEKEEEEEDHGLVAFEPKNKT